jgi:hypothetical protein
MILKHTKAFDKYSVEDEFDKTNCSNASLLQNVHIVIVIE